MPSRPPAQTAPPVESRANHPGNLPPNRPLRTPVHHRTNAVPHLTRTQTGTSPVPDGRGLALPGRRRCSAMCSLTTSLPRCPGTFTGPDRGLRPGPPPAVPGFAADAGAVAAQGGQDTRGARGWAVALRQRRQARSVRVSTVRQMIRSRHLDFPHKTKCEPSRRLSAEPGQHCGQRTSRASPSVRSARCGSGAVVTGSKTA